MARIARAISCACLFLGLSVAMFASATMANDEKTSAAVRQAHAEGKLNGLHSVMVVHKGKVLVEEYFAGTDERWGAPLPDRKHGPETLHDLRSVTKSVTALLYGIALAEGKVPAIADKLVQHFPEYADLAADPKRAAITISDVLTMQMGTEWDETLPYSDPRNSEIAMEQAKDRIRYALSRPMVEKPGSRWNYNGGATALIARLIAKGTGQSLEDFAQARLFMPLGIEKFDWVKGADGQNSAASGLRLQLRDLAKIGQLVATGGSFGGKQIVPKDWLDAMLTPSATTPDGLRYGYFWWLAPQGSPPIWVAGFGNGGQRLTVQPKYDLVIAVFAGNYNMQDAWTVPVTLIDKYLIPGLRDTILGK